MIRSCCAGLSILCEFSDFIVIAGGVSVGERNFVRELLEVLEVETDFWRVRIKPGKPFLFGKHPNGCLIFSLSGNPVSAYVTFQPFVSPALRKRLGQIVEADALGKVVSLLGKAGKELSNPGDHLHYLPGVETDGQVLLSGTKQSYAVLGLSKSNYLVRLEADQTVAAGESMYGIGI